jgi:hypothetical protein
VVRVGVVCVGIAVVDPLVSRHVGDALGVVVVVAVGGEDDVESWASKIKYGRRSDKVR